MTKTGKLTGQNKQVLDLISQGKTNPEIAQILKCSKATVAVFVQRFVAGGNPNYRIKKTKHKHLHEKALNIFLNNSMEDTAKELNLTMSELKSCLAYAYKNPSFKHLRKDERRHDEWSIKETTFLLKYSGIIPQSEISLKLKRGKNRIVIKERLQKMGLCSKIVNGLTLSQFRKIWGFDPEYILQTTAGSPGGLHGKNDTFFKIVPWAYVDELIKNKKIDHEDSIKKYISTMAMFQKWIHGPDYWKSLTRIRF